MIDFHRLTALDMSVLEGLLNGENNTQIADRLCVTVRLVEKRCARIQHIFNGETT